MSNPVTIQMTVVLDELEEYGPTIAVAIRDEVSKAVRQWTRDAVAAVGAEAKEAFAKKVRRALDEELKKED